MELKTKFNVGDKVFVIEHLSRTDLYNRISGGYFISRDEIREIIIGNAITYTMKNSNRNISEENIFSLEDIENCINKLKTLVLNKELEKL